MSTAASLPPFLVVGNPANRRVRLFEEAAKRLGCTVRTLAWRDVIRDPAALEEVPESRHLVRIDSFGEDAEVEGLLLDRGRDRARHAPCEVVERGVERRFGQVLGPRQAHLGFLDVLAEIEPILAARTAWQVVQPLDAIRTCFDKNATAHRLAERGVPVAPSIPCEGARDVLDAHQSAGRPLWVKVTCSSSASCLAVVRGGARPHLMTTLRETTDGRFNSLRVCRVQGEGVEPMLEWLLNEGARVEVDRPKARLDGAFFDLRVVVIGGEPRFVVVRQSRHAITNLHLGGWRGDLEHLWERLGPEGKAHLVAVCREVGQAIPHWYLGVDVLVGPDFRTLTVLEVNAFGDLLPNLTNAGLDTYGVEIVACLPGGGVEMLDSL